MHDFMLITKALSDQNRVRALFALQGRELCVCQIIALFDLAPSTISKHMSILKNARLVECRKQGRWNYYRVAEKNAYVEAAEAVAWVFRSLDKSPEIIEDRKRLRKILEIDPEKLCQRIE
jgi:DNA-binding transcriptional ArsR family regulator